MSAEQLPELTTEDREQMGIRIAALDRAIEVWAPNKEFVSPNGKDIRTGRVLDTAKAFEAYLRGQEATDV